MGKLTVRGLQSAKAGDWISDGGTRGGGTLVARKLPSEKLLLYFRYTNSAGQREALPLGEWSGTGGPLSLQAARVTANELSTRYRTGERDLSAVLAVERRESERLLAANERQRLEAASRERATLGALLLAYVADLQARGKLDSARDTAGAVRRHVTEPWPDLATKPADSVTLQDLVEIVRRVTSQAKLNEARKLRSYLRAAYTAGINAQQDATSCPDLVALHITTNPASNLAPIKGASRAGDRNLNLSELQAYWRRIEGMTDFTGAALRFHLLTGAQRQKQLGRATVQDYDTKHATLSIYDGKGRRDKPERHLVPLIPAAIDALHQMAPERAGQFIFSLTCGVSGITHGDLSRRLRSIVNAMSENGELPYGSFTLADLRRTVETQLAAARVSKEHRGHLQSHGRGGVQDKHYDRHDYLDEKRAALQVLFRLLHP